MMLKNPDDSQEFPEKGAISQVPKKVIICAKFRTIIYFVEVHNVVYSRESQVSNSWHDKHVKSQRSLVPV